jgi:transposase-like protein
VARIDLDPDELRRLLVDERRSFTEVARVFGVSGMTVARRAHDLGVESAHRRVKRPELHDGEWLRAKFDAGRTIAEVAAELGVHPDSVTHARRRFGIAPTRAPRRRVDVAEVRHRLEAGESMGTIGRALGHSSSAISKVAHRHGLICSNSPRSHVSPGSDR